MEHGDLDPQLAQAAAATQQPREGTDYRMERFSKAQARATLELAVRFVAAVKETIEASETSPPATGPQTSTEPP